LLTSSALPLTSWGFFLMLPKTTTSMKIRPAIKNGK